MAKVITEIQGIGLNYAEKLQVAGIKTVEALLETGSEKTGRAEIAKASGLSEELILDWVNMADLFRIKGIGGQFAELLKASGVDTVKELAQRNPQNLYATLNRVNVDRSLTRAIPNMEKIVNFIEQAKSMDPAVFH